MNYKYILLTLINLIFITNGYSVSNYSNDLNKNSKSLLDSIDVLLKLANDLKNRGDYEQALIYTERTHRFRKIIYPDTSMIMIRSFINMANAKVLVYEYEEALFFLQEAEKLIHQTKNKNSDELGTMYSYYGRIYKNKGDYLLAIQYMQKAEEFLLSRTLQNKHKQVSNYMQLADLEMRLGNIDESLDYYDKSHNIIKQLVPNTRLLINYYTGLALTYSTTGDFKKSIQLQEKAIQIAVRDSSENALWLAILFNNIGLDYLEIDQYQQAEESFQAALRIFKQLGIRGSNLAELYESIGMLCYHKGLYTHALEQFQKALEITAPEMPTNKVMVNPELNQIEAQVSALKILKSKVTCLEALFIQKKEMKYLDGAIQTALLAIDLIDYLRKSYQNYESMFQTTKHEYGIYNTALSLLNIAFQHTGNKLYNELIFTISEKSKSSVLLSVLNELDARQLGEIPDSLLALEKSLTRYVTFYKEHIYEERQSPAPDSVKIRIWENYLFDAQRKRTELIGFFEKNYAEYYNLKYENSVTLLHELQEYLPFRTSLIEYCISDSVLYTLIITRNGYNIIRQSIDSCFYQVLNKYLNTFHHFDFSKQSLNDLSEFCLYSNSLYNYLIAPAKDFISGNSLILVPDGLLSYLPFETLLRKMPDHIPSSQYRTLDYLVNEFRISYVYSATLFDQVISKNKQTAEKKLLAFAPEYTEEPGEAMNLTRNKYRKDLNPIPGIYDEVNSIHGLITGDVYFGEKATEKNFIAFAGNYDILHLAMHTVIDNNNPLYSKLIFSSDSDSGFDGYLNTNEVFGLDLKARLVVLSACSTGEGEFNKGEGVMSLARGFVYAGTPSIVMSLWEVEDKSGAELMKNFYKNLLRGQSKSEAMRNAKLTGIKNARPENSHPFFWSSFVVMGNSQPLFTNKIEWIGIGSGIVFLLIVLLAGLRAFRKL